MIQVTGYSKKSQKRSVKILITVFFIETFTNKNCNFQYLEDYSSDCSNQMVEFLFYFLEIYILKVFSTISKNKNKKNLEFLENWKNTVMI